MALVIEVRDIPPGGLRIEGELEADELDLAMEAASPAGALKYDLRAEVVSNQLLVSGTLDIPVEFSCARCLKQFVLTVHVGGYGFNAAVTEEGQAIDLTASVREDIIMALPVKPLCTQECKGICPRCGANLNQERCSCPPRSSEQRWEALDDIVLPPESET